MSAKYRRRQCLYCKKFLKDNNDDYYCNSRCEESDEQDTMRPIVDDLGLDFVSDQYVLKFRKAVNGIINASEI